QRSFLIMENKVICHCMNVSYADIEKALHEHQVFTDVEREFEEIQKVTHCSTGCGGCHDEILGVISEIMSK
ncbi:MAG: (2Fe-2S)-binding protein, partial [Ruminococcus sp.]